MLSRRLFLGLLAAPAAGGFGRSVMSSSIRAQRDSFPDHPILRTLEPVIAGARHVRLHRDKVGEVAGWMAYEGLPWPDFRSPLVPDGDDQDTMDFIFLTSTINFAFTDFSTHSMFKVRYEGAERSDSDAMEACLKRAYDHGTPILEGDYLSKISRAELDEMWRSMRRILRELHGVESSADPEKRSGGLIKNVEIIRDLLENGGAKRKWDKVSVTVASSVVAASGAVILGVVLGIMRL